MKKIILTITLIIIFSFSNVNACLPYGESDFIIGRIESLDKEKHKIKIDNYINIKILPIENIIDNLYKSLNLYFQRKQIYNYSEYSDEFYRACTGIKINTKIELKNKKKGDYVYMTKGIDSSLNYNFASNIGSINCVNDEIYLYGKYSKNFNKKIGGCDKLALLLNNDKSFEDIEGNKVMIYYIFKYFIYLLIIFFIFIILKINLGKK